MFKRKWHWAIAILVIIGIGGFVLFGSKVPLETVKIYKVSQPEDFKTQVFKPPPPGETVESGHWHGDVWHAKSHGRMTSTNEKGSQPQDPPGRDPASTEKQLTRLEKALLERGIDINQLPRGPNGELIRGPTGGIALVPNPIAPTEEDIERFEKNRQLRQRLIDIKGEMEVFPKDVMVEVSTKELLHRLDLQEERLHILQELNVPIRTDDGHDPFVALELTRFTATLMSENPEGFPVSATPRLVAFHKELNQHDMADAIQKASTKALENGKAFFTLLQD